MRYLVVGSPVAHSLSPAMMTAAFERHGLDATYDAREIAPESWPRALTDLHAEEIDGMNVTVPHKEGALAGADTASETATAIGAANVLVRTNRGWHAHNTDGPGFLEWVAELGAGDLLTREAWVLGAGGSARAIVWALEEGGCPRVRVTNRTPERAEEIALWAGERTVAEAWGGSAPPGGLVVNCTTVGLAAGDPPPIDPEALAGAGRVLDLVYPETELVRAAREVGVPADHGLGLLVAQGALSLERWTGIEADRSAMRAGAERELARRAG